MTQAERICQGVDKDLKKEAVTLAKAVIAMRDKIDQQIPIYKQMPLAQNVTVGTGEKMLRQNPATQEFRATVRDYASALSDLQKLVSSKQTAQDEETGLDDLRAQFRIAK